VVGHDLSAGLPALSYLAAVAAMIGACLAFAVATNANKVQ